MALFPSRAASSGFGRRAEWMPRTGNYPSRLEALAGELPPIIPPMPINQPPAAAPPAAPSAPAAPPVRGGTVPLEPFPGAEGLGGAPGDPNASNWGVDIGRDLGMGWQDMIGPALTMAAFPGSALGLIGGMVFDDVRGQPLSTRSFTDIALQAVGLPTTTQMMRDVITPTPAPAPAAPAPSTPSASPAGVDYAGVNNVLGQVGALPGPQTDPMTGLWGEIANGAQFGGWGASDFAGLSDTLSGAGIMGGAPASPEVAGMWGDIAGANLSDAVSGGYGGYGGGYGGGEGQGGGFGGASAGSPGGGGGGFGGEEGTSSVWMTGGVVPPGQTGIVHGNEGVLNPAAMQHYGDAARMAVAAINARAVPKNRLEDLIRLR